MTAPLESAATHAPGNPRRPLRILYPASLWPGGAERQMLLLVARLPPERFRTAFVLLGGDTPLADEARRAGATVHVLGAPRRAGMPLPLFAARVGARVVDYVRLCRRERYDVVDAWLYLGYGLAALTDPLTRIPVFISGRRSLSGFKARFGRAEQVVDGLARRASDAYVANSFAVADDVARREGIPRERIRVIHNGVEAPPPMDAADRARVRAAWGVPADGPVVGVVGTMKPGKGQDRVIRTLPGILETAPDTRLVLLGDGPERPALEGLVASLGLTRRVTFAGQVPDARPLYAAIDVLASASDAEGLPNVVLEAAAAGVAIAATDAGGTREIVEDGEGGILVPVGDDGALGGAVARLLGDPELRARLGGRGREHALAAFGVDRFVAETADLYEELTAARRARARARTPQAARDSAR